jgi:hypothetical protein
MIVTIEEDQNGDLILPIPQDIIDQMGWDEETILLWEQMDNGSFVLKKKETIDE